MIARHPRRWGQRLSPWLSPPDDTESKPLITIGSFKVAIIDPIIGPIIFTIMSFLGPIFD